LGHFSRSFAGLSGLKEPVFEIQSTHHDDVEPLDPVFEITEKSVVMLDIRSDWVAELRRMFMALGVDVFYALDAPEIGPAPLLLVDNEGHKRSNASGYIDYARTMHLGASLFIVMADVASSDAYDAAPVAQYDDTRALLVAAGVSFISGSEA